MNIKEPVKPRTLIRDWVDAEIYWHGIDHPPPHKQWRATFNHIEIGGFGSSTGDEKEIPVFFGNTKFEDSAASPEEARAWVERKFMEWLQAAIENLLPPEKCKTCNGHNWLVGRRVMRDGRPIAEVRACPDCNPDAKNPPANFTEEGE